MAELVVMFGRVVSFHNSVVLLSAMPGTDVLSTKVTPRGLTIVQVFVALHFKI